MRIGYIDTAKGICILLVMMIHIGVPQPIPNIYSIKVPLFFVLSGFFMKDVKTSFVETTQRGINRLMIPFIFFYLLSYVVFYVGGAIYPALYNITEATGILDCFTQKQYFNGPL